MNTLCKLQSIAKACNRPAARFVPFDLRQLIGDSFILSPSVRDYFQNVPEAAIDSDVARLLSARDIYSEAKSAIPSCYTVEYGFVPIATDYSGDTFAVDVSDGMVFLLSHEKYESDGIHTGWNHHCTAVLPPRPVNREAIIETSEANWKSLTDFLDEFPGSTKS